ncbi:vgr related protein [Sphingomonas sp. HMWF008]|nr:vgr related protein [Sphingomonas sp. HMWF008]
MSARPLTSAEIDLARSVFGDAIDYAPVRIEQRKWAFFQPRETVMAPTGCIHFHPKGTRYRDDFACGNLDDQGLLIHELTHIWQSQSGIYLPLRRHPFCRYDYAVHVGWPLKRYGIEQQAEIVRHTFVLRRGGFIRGAAALSTYESILPFRPV